MQRISYFIVSLLAFSLIQVDVSAQKTKEFVVVLDAGHGGKDPGAIGSSKKNREKDINLGVVLEIGRLLKANCNDVKVIYTRSTDVFVELDKRANIANKAKADLFVSVHTNALPKGGRQVSGVQSYTLTLKTAETNLEVEKRENSVIQFEENGAQKYSFANPNSSESDIMFELMQDRDMKESVNFAKLTQNEMVRTGGRRDMGVLQANLAVLRLTYMPSVLLEVGYISTPSEERFLLSKSGQTALAKCIYNAISRYKAQYTGQMSALEKITPEGKDVSEVKNEMAQAISPNEEKDTPEEKGDTNKDNIADEGSNLPVFKIQILASTRKVIEGSREFKGLKTEEIHEGKMYKYTYGSTNDYNEILQMKKSIAAKFPKAFVIAFKNGQRMETYNAIAEYKAKKNTAKK
ncbi:MAG: N-acetylmuramoyl-L-alanine amidase [Prevotellaceae bacterium]|nr:N-acetylmuramoyl-L-alanine amidase [Prevotellaceae bacterium]